MKSDSIKQYISLRDSLVREKKQLEERLEQINQALGEKGKNQPAVPRQEPAQASAARSAPERRGRGRRSTGLSLREAVIQALSKGPLTKEEVLAAVKALGYRFSTSNPMNSLGVILYGKSPRFKNAGGRFSLDGDAAAAPHGRTDNSNHSYSNGSANGHGGAFSRKRRQLSPEARERIAAAQRARWAKNKK